MQRIATAFVLGAALMATAAPALARGGHPNSGYEINFGVAAPAALLDGALTALRRGDARQAAADVELAQHRLITYTMARNLPDSSDRIAMRDAASTLDGARRALARGDAAGAESAITAARALL